MPHLGSVVAMPTSGQPSLLSLFSVASCDAIGWPLKFQYHETYMVSYAAMRLERTFVRRYLTTAVPTPIFVAT